MTESVEHMRDGNVYRLYMTDSSQPRDKFAVNTHDAQLLHDNRRLRVVLLYERSFTLSTMQTFLFYPDLSPYRVPGRSLPPPRFRRFLVYFRVKKATILQSITSSLIYMLETVRAEMYSTKISCYNNKYIVDILGDAR